MSATAAVELSLQLDAQLAPYSQWLHLVRILVYGFQSFCLDRKRGDLNRVFGSAILGGR